MIVIILSSGFTTVVIYGIRLIQFFKEKGNFVSSSNLSKFISFPFFYVLKHFRHNKNCTDNNILCIYRKLTVM